MRACRAPSASLIAATVLQMGGRARARSKVEPSVNGAPLRGAAEALLGVQCKQRQDALRMLV